jgi:hypothetical protein
MSISICNETLNLKSSLARASWQRLDGCLPMVRIVSQRACEREIGRCAEGPGWRPQPVWVMRRDDSPFAVGARHVRWHDLSPNCLVEPHEGMD